MKKHPLSDLSFFRFPDLTPDVLRNIVMLILLLMLTVLVTVMVQRWLTSRGTTRGKKAMFDRFSSTHHMPQHLRDVLSSLLRHASVSDEFELVNDAQAYEQAVDTFAASADEDTLADLSRLRRMLHLNVMNPDLELVSTRQLLPDLPVRLTTSLGEERLDLYCAVLGLDESSLFIDLPHHASIFTALRSHPEVFLLHWRERDGETAFPVRLEPLDQRADGDNAVHDDFQESTITAFRIDHVLRDPGDFHRENFRLSVNTPVVFQFIERTELAHRRKDAKQKRAPLANPEGEGMLIDLGFGGASFTTTQRLSERGFAQLRFELNSQPLRMMIEVLSCTESGSGRYLVRGQFRGIGEEARARIHNILTHEQVKRLREKALLHIRPGEENA